MKNSLKYLKLWQQKRNELPVNGDAGNDWHQMQSLLDTHLPATLPKAAKWHGFKGLKFLPKMFIALSAAAAVYTASHFLLSNKQKHKADNNKEKSKLAVKDSVLKDSLATLGDTAFRDSMNLIRQKDSALVNSGDNANESSTTTKEAHGVLSKKDSTNAGEKDKEYASGSTLKGKGQPALSSSAIKNKLLAANLTNNKTAGLARNGSHGPVSPTITTGSESKGHKGKHGKLSTIPGNPDNKVNDDVTNQKQLPNADAKTGDDKPGTTFLMSSTPPLAFNLSLTTMPTLRLPNLAPQAVSKSKAGKQQTVKQKKDKNPRAKNTGPSNLDWGIMAGVNSSGSFTPKSQNANFYGSAPVDIFFGLFGNYKISDKWAIGTQIQLFSPQTVTTSYTHANASKVDSNQSLTITSSRKLYNINIPIHAIYKVSDNVSIKAGPVLSFPVKQINTSSTLQPAAIRSDSAYFAQVSGVINSTNYQKSFNLGVSGGVSVQFKRFMLEATYLKSISGYKVTSNYGTYKSNSGTLQFTIGFKLNKSKK